MIKFEYQAYELVVRGPNPKYHKYIGYNGIYLNNGYFFIRDQSINKFKLLDSNSNIVEKHKNYEFYNLYCKVKIKTIEDSIYYFGHKKIKKDMLNSNILFKISEIKEDYKSIKFGGKLIDYISLEYEGKNFKFIASDLEIIYPNFKGFTVPKDRIIRNNSECIVKKNKGVNIPIDSKIKVKKITKLNDGRNIAVFDYNNKEQYINLKNLKKL